MFGYTQNPVGGRIPRNVRIARPDGLTAASLSAIVSSLALLLSIGAFVASMYAVTAARDPASTSAPTDAAPYNALQPIMGQRDCLLLLGDAGELTCRKILASVRHQVWRDDGHEPTPECPVGYFSVATNANDHILTPLDTGDSIVGFNLCAQSG